MLVCLLKFVFFSFIMELDDLVDLLVFFEMSEMWIIYFCSIVECVWGLKFSELKKKF